MHAALARAFRRYGEVVRIPHVAGAVATALVGRLPVGMEGLAIVLLIRQETGSYATAGLVAATYAISAGLIAPAQGRLIDRFGIPKVVAPLSAAQPLALALLIVAAHGEASTAALALCGVAVGLLFPPLFAAIQSLMTSLARPGNVVEVAFALEAILQEFVFLLGPVIVTVLASAGSPTLALAGCGVLTFTGGLSFAATRGARRFRSERADRGGRGGALASPGIRTFALVGIATGAAFGILEVAMPAFAGEHGSPSTAGILLGAVSLGSIFGGLWHGTRSPEGSLSDRYLAYLVGLAAALAPLTLASSNAAMIPLAVVAGVFIAPSFATELAMVSRLAPAGKLTEAFTWLSMAVVVGIAGGNALCGVLVEGPGVATALLVSSGFAAVAAIVAFARRRTLLAA